MRALFNNSENTLDISPQRVYYCIISIIQLQDRDIPVLPGTSEGNSRQKKNAR